MLQVITLPIITCATAEELGLDYEIVPVADREAYFDVLACGDIDIWMDFNGGDEAENVYKYKTTNPYLTTTVSVLHTRDASEKIHRLAVVNSNTAIREILSATWPDAEVLMVSDTKECVKQLAEGKVDGALLMTYTAQKLSVDDIQNRFRVDIVPDASLDLKMAVNANDDHNFYGLWKKTLSNVSDQLQAEVIQPYVEETATPTILAYLFIFTIRSQLFTKYLQFGQTFFTNVSYTKERKELMQFNFFS